MTRGGSDPGHLLECAPLARPEHLTAAHRVGQGSVMTLPNDWWATSSRNGGRNYLGMGGRHHSGIMGGLLRNPHQKPDPLADLYEKALAWRDAREKYKGQVIHADEEGQPLWTYQDEFLSQISEEAKEFLETHGEQAATSFFKIAKGEGKPLRDLIDTWLAESAGTITAQTSAQHRTVVTAFLEWAGQGLLVEDVDAGRSLWRWLMARGVAGGNPWRGHDIGRKSKRGETPRGGQWTDAGLKKLLTGTHTPQYTGTFHDLVRLALVTGARLDELCSLKTSDAHHPTGANGRGPPTSLVGTRGG
jgi:hypothetical protein